MRTVHDKETYQSAVFVVMWYQVDCYMVVRLALMPRARFLLPLYIYTTHKKTNKQKKDVLNLLSAWACSDLVC